MSKFQPGPASPPEAMPDGGWGWVVVGALFVSSALVFGLIRSLGVFFVEFVQYFDESAQVISWITSIGVAMQQLVSPVGTALCYAYGARPVVMIGGLLSGMGFILASQATCVTHVYLTMGVISGSGWALVFTPTVASVMQYFTRRRSLAMALGFTGIGLSSFAFSPLFQFLVDTYTWRGALLILGGLSFNMVACGALIRPQAGLKMAVENPASQADSDTPSSTFSSILSKAYSYLELSLLFQRPFLTYSLAITLFNFGYFVPYVHLVAHSHHEGFSQYQAAFIISATGVTDIVGRLLSGWWSDMGRLRLPHMLCVWTGLTGLFLLLLPLGSLGGSYPGLVVVSLAYGFCSGAMTPLVFSVVPEIVGMQRTLGALGLLQLIESVGGLLGAPLSGLLRDITGNFTASFVVAGISVILGTLVMTMLPHFFSCTTPPPLAGQRTPAGQDGKGAESPLMKTPSSFTEGLNHLDAVPFSEPQLERSSLNLDREDTPLKQSRAEADDNC